MDSSPALKRLYLKYNGLDFILIFQHQKLNFYNIMSSVKFELGGKYILL